MTRLRAFGASAAHARLRLSLLLLVVALGLLAARSAAAQTEIVEYYGHDALGSIRIVFTASGVATARADYEPFGEGVTIAGMPAGPLPAQQFTGQERDALERQDYFGARYYRPRHGRFSQVDPVWGNLFDPQQLNRYAYVGNSPLRYVDPDGRTRLDADCQQLDLTFAKCLSYTAPDGFLLGLLDWQRFLRQGPTFVGGGPGGRRPQGPTDGGDTGDDEDGHDGSDNGNNSGSNSSTKKGQNTGDEGDASSETAVEATCVGIGGGRFPNSISNRARDTFWFMNGLIPGVMLPAGSGLATTASARAAQAFGTPTLLDVGLAARAGAATIVRGGVSWTLFEGAVVGGGVGLIASVSVGLAAEIGLGIGSYVAAVSTHPCAGK